MQPLSFRKKKRNERKGKTNEERHSARSCRLSRFNQSKTMCLEATTLVLTIQPISYHPAMRTPPRAKISWPFSPIRKQREPKQKQKHFAPTNGFSQLSSTKRLNPAISKRKAFYSAFRWTQISSVFSEDLVGLLQTTSSFHSLRQKPR